MDGYFFFGFRNRGTIHCNYTDWNRQDNVKYNSECVRLKEECQTRLGCPDGISFLVKISLYVIFNFFVHVIPFPCHIFKLVLPLRIPLYQMQPSFQSQQISADYTRDEHIQIHTPSAQSSWQPFCNTKQVISASSSQPKIFCHLK